MGKLISASLITIINPFLICLITKVSKDSKLNKVEQSHFHKSITQNQHKFRWRQKNPWFDFTSWSNYSEKPNFKRKSKRKSIVWIKMKDNKHNFFKFWIINLPNRWNKKYFKKISIKNFQWSICQTSAMTLYFFINEREHAWLFLTTNSIFMVEQSEENFIIYRKIKLI